MKPMKLISPLIYPLAPLCQSSLSNQLLPSSSYTYSLPSQWFDTLRSSNPRKCKTKYSNQQSNPTKYQDQYNPTKLKPNPVGQITFLGKNWAFFFSTSWYNSFATFSHTWHLMYGMSSFLALKTGFLAQRETGTHVDATNEVTKTTSICLILAMPLSQAAKSKALFLDLPAWVNVIKVI